MRVKYTCMRLTVYADYTDTDYFAAQNGTEKKNRKKNVHRVITYEFAEKKKQKKILRYD